MRTSFFRKLVQAVLLLLALFAAPALSYDQVPQVDLSIPMSAKFMSHKEFKTSIPPGTAMMVGTARNLLSGETVLIDLAFYYKIPWGTIAFDELIHGIEIATESKDGEVFGSVSIDTKSINLNPNRASFFYRTTLYYPKDSENYILHIRVLGNYE